MVDELSVVGKLIAKTETGNIKWYEDNNSEGAWRRAELSGYQLNLFVGGDLTVSSSGTMLNTYTGEEVTALKAAIDAYLEVQLAAKASAFENELDGL